MVGSPREMPPPGLPFRWMLISDRRQMGPDPVRTAAQRLQELNRAEAADFSPVALQWREKEQSPHEIYDSLIRLQQLLENSHPRSGPRTVPPGSPCDADTTPNLSATPPVGSSTPLFVNDRVDLALALGIHVHLTEASLPTRVVRDLLPTHQLVGRSVHSLDRALQAEREGADYVLFGPIFATPSKRAFGEPQGIARLAELTRILQIPVVAVGGIDPTNLKDVFAAGASAWAAIAAAWNAPKPD